MAELVVQKNFSEEVVRVDPQEVLRVYKNIVPKEPPLKQVKHILEYYNRIVANKKQPQATKVLAGMSHVSRSPGTNKGRTRMKYALIGNRTVVKGAPGTRGGRVALRVLKNQTSLKMNEKERVRAIKFLLYKLVREVHLYDLTNIQPSRTSEVLRKIESVLSKDNLSLKKNNSLKKLGPVLILSESKKMVFQNISKTLDLNKGTNFFGLFNGARLRTFGFIQKEELFKLLDKYFERNLE